MLKPIPDHVMVKKKERISNTGLIAFVENDVQMRGEISAVHGPDGEFSIGDEVMFGKNSGKPLRINGIDYLLIRESDVMAFILEKNENNT